MSRSVGQSYEVVVVGSGSAGSVVVRRLVDAGVRVCLLEAGGPDNNPAIDDPARCLELQGSADDWDYVTVPQAACARRELHIPRGKVLGGSSSMNGMIYIRGHRSDYDHWAYLGNPGWAYEDVLPLFRRSEDFDGGESRYHGWAASFMCKRATSRTRFTHRSWWVRRRRGSRSTQITMAPGWTAPASRS